VSERTLKQLVGALALAVGVWLIATIFVRGGGSIGASGEIGRFFAGVDGSSVEAVTIRRGGDTIALERGPSGWTVNGFPADSTNVSRLTTALGEAVIGDLVATNPANHARMGVTDDSAAAVELDAGGVPRTILVGGAGRRFGTAYVRLPGADEVYLLDGDLRAQVVRDLDQWRNRTMVAIDTARVARVQVERDGDAYALVRGDSAWAFEGGGEVATAALNGVLSELARLVASGFLVEGDSIAGLETASTTRAYDANGDLLAEITVGSGEGDRWARTASDDYVYRVSSFRAGRIAPTREDAEPGS
jgi:hypothetical protein